MHSVKTLKTHPRSGKLYGIGPCFSQPAGEPPASGGGSGGVGDGGSGGVGSGGTEGDPGSNTGGSGERTFTQADVDRIAGQRAAEGKKAAEKSIADKLGVSIEEAATILKKHTEAEEAKQTEADKAAAAAAKAKKEAEDAKAEAARELHEARVERALAAQGFPVMDKDRLARIRRSVTAEVGASYEDVEKDVQELKKLMPEQFGGTAGGGKPGAPAGDPPGSPPTPAGGEDKFDAGKKRAESLYQKSRRTFNPLDKASSSTGTGNTR